MSLLYLILLLLDCLHHVLIMCKPVLSAVSYCLAVNVTPCSSLRIHAATYFSQI